MSYWYVEAVKPDQPDHAIIEIIKEDDSMRRTQIMEARCNSWVRAAFEYPLSDDLGFYLESADEAGAIPDRDVGMHVEDLTELVRCSLRNAKYIFHERLHTNRLPRWIDDVGLPSNLSKKNAGLYVDELATMHLEGGGSETGIIVALTSREIYRVTRELLSLGQVRAYMMHNRLD